MQMNTADRRRSLFLSYVVVMGFVSLGCPNQSDTDPREGAIDETGNLCQSEGVLLRVASGGGGGPVIGDFETLMFPYGRSTWIVDGGCRSRSLADQNSPFLGMNLDVPASREILEISQSPLFQTYDRRTFGMCLDGPRLTYASPLGSFYCWCKCEHLPRELGELVARIDQLQRSVHKVSGQIDGDVGLIALHEESKEWEGYNKEVLDAVWQHLEFPPALQQVALANESGYARIVDLERKAELRRIKQEHLIWQQTLPVHYFRRPGFVYIKNAAGQKFILGINELVEPEFALPAELPK